MEKEEDRSTRVRGGRRAVHGGRCGGEGWSALVRRDRTPKGPRPQDSKTQSSWSRGRKATYVAAGGADVAAVKTELPVSGCGSCSDSGRRRQMPGLCQRRRHVSFRCFFLVKLRGRSG
jgi:hypothetical protein